MAYSKQYKEKLGELDKDLSLNDLLELVQNLYDEGIITGGPAQNLINQINEKQSRLVEIMDSMENEIKYNISEVLRFYLVYKKKTKKEGE